MKDLAGKAAVVTGAGGGLGAALCSALAAEGMQVAMYDLDTEALDPARAAVAATAHEWRPTPST